MIRCGRPAIPGMPGMAGSHENWGNFKCHKWGELLRHSQIAGRQFWLWRAVDDEGEVLDLLVQRRRDRDATVKLVRKQLKKQGFRARGAGDRQASLLRRDKVRDRIVGSP